MPHKPKRADAQLLVQMPGPPGCRSPSPVSPEGRVSFCLPNGHSWPLTVQPSGPNSNDLGRKEVGAGEPCPGSLGIPEERPRGQGIGSAPSLRDAPWDLCPTLHHCVHSGPALVALAIARTRTVCWSSSPCSGPHLPCAAQASCPSGARTLCGCPCGPHPPWAAP